MVPFLKSNYSDVVVVVEESGVDISSNKLIDDVQSRASTISASALGMQISE